MDQTNRSFKTVNEYISTFPAEVKEILSSVRQAIQAEAPEAEETINYRMPTFKLKGKNLIHFAAFKNHIGLYPTPSGVAAFKQELAGYKQAKGSIQFPINQPMPLDLIRAIVRFRVKEMQSQA